MDNVQQYADCTYHLADPCDMDPLGQTQADRSNDQAEGNSGQHPFQAQPVEFAKMVAAKGYYTEQQEILTHDVSSCD
jgi:hypothetical protein